MFPYTSLHYFYLGVCFHPPVVTQNTRVQDFKKLAENQMLNFYQKSWWSVEDDKGRLGPRTRVLVFVLWSCEWRSLSRSIQENLQDLGWPWTCRTSGETPTNGFEQPQEKLWERCELHKKKMFFFCVVESSSLIAFKILILHLEGFAEEKTSCDTLATALGMESDSPSFN